MGSTDFNIVFEHLDAPKLGYITLPQIEGLLNSLYVSRLHVSHVEAAVRHVCGLDGRVSRDQFVDVLMEVERRQAVEEQGYWDFQALDYNGDHKINLRDALMLFQEIHGENFSLETWHTFLESRGNPDADVYFDEIRGWLCDVPLPGSSDPQLVKDEETRLDEILMINTDNEMRCLKDIQKLSGADSEDTGELEDIKFHAKRKLNKWNKQGVASLLYDDGLEVEQDETKKTKKQDNVSMANIIEALDAKYTQIQDKLLMVMAKYAANVEGEHTEIFHQLKQQLHKIRPRSLDAEVWDLPGSQAALPSSLWAIMGELADVNQARLKRVEEWKTSLRAEGKSQKEIDAIIRQDYETFIEGSGTCGNLLICLKERHKQEKSAVMDRVRGQTVTTIALAAERTSLERQLCLLEEESEFYTAAVAVGLAERSPPVKTRGYNWDRVRTEELASLRLSTRKGQKPTKSSKSFDRDIKGQGLLDLQLKVVTEIERKQYLEREAFMNMLQGPEANAAIMSVESLSAGERRRRKMMLRHHHVSWRESARLDTTTDVTNHLSQLQNAVAIHWVQQQAEAEKNFTHVGDEDLAASILADMQETQEQEFAVKLKEIAKQTSLDYLTSMLRKETKARILEFFDNISAVVLGTTEVTDSEREYTDALTDKYKALKDHIFTFALKDKHGAEWERISPEEKEKEISKLRRQEENLRAEGKLEEMTALIGPRAQALPSLIVMMGESKEYQTSDSLLETNRPGMNILADLGTRHDVEEDNLLSWLRLSSVQTMAGSERRLALLKIQLEKLSATKEENYEVAFIATGLLERLQKNRYNRSPPDKERQNHLAGKRVTLRRHKLNQEEQTSFIYKQNPKPTGDLYDLRLNYMLEILQLHEEEREALLNLLQDESFADLTEAAELMSHDERQLRLYELAGKRQKLNLENQDDRDEYVCILEEAAAVQSVCKKLVLKSSSPPSVDEIAAAILSDLQDSQESHLSDILQELGMHNEETLLSLWSKASHEREIQSVKNVFDVLTLYEDVGREKDLLQIVEEKYSVLRNQLIQEGLKKNHAKVKMSVKEMQTMLDQAVCYWNDNNQKALVDLIGADFKLGESLESVMGVDRRQWALWLMEQTGSDTVLMENSQPGTAEEHVIQQLMDRFNNEKIFIKETLKGSYGKMLTPSDREILMSRILREIALIRGCDKFKMAATFTGLLERQTIAKNACLSNDRNRYKAVAEGEWVKLKSVSKSSKNKTSVEIVQSPDRLSLQNNVLAMLNSLHQEERQFLLQWLDVKKDVEIENFAKLSSQQERTDQLAALKVCRSKLKDDDVKENSAILEEAAVLKKESRRFKLAGQNRNGDDVTDTDVVVSLLADLLLQQNSDAELYLRKFATAGVDELASMQTVIKFYTDCNHCENVATVLFSAEDLSLSSEEELTQAVESKYSALNDKLLAEALMKQVGEAKWLDLSERERQQRLMMLKLKQKQLQRDGKYDEAAALLGDALKDQEALKKLMGDSQADYERKLKQRLEKRKERLDKGLSEEECNILEEEDIQKEEEEENKEKKNILLELETRLVQEKDLILNQMKLAENEYEREQERQRTLIRLKREQRRVHQEDNFVSAARLLGISEHNANKLKTQQEEERARQEKLAQQRLEKARSRKKQDNTSTQQDDDDVNLNVDDKSLLETLLKIADRKHTLERKYFTELLFEDNANTETLDQVTNSEIDSRLENLRELRENWKKSDDSLPEQQTAIFQEAIHLSMELKKRNLKERGLPHSAEDCQVSLLTDLQQCQDREIDSLMSQAENKDTDFLKALCEKQIEDKKKGTCDNIANIVLSAEGAQLPATEILSEEMTPEKQVIDALEKKYDVLKDKLIVEALMKQMGEAEWEHLSELERQKHLIKMRLKEKRLKKEGKMDEVAMLLGQHLQNEEEIAKLLDDTRLSQKEQLKARLARHRQLKAEREAQGLSADDDTLNEILQKEEKEKPSRKNILETLQTQFEDEKSLLLSNLARQTDHIQAERERQLTLARLRRDRKVLQREDKIDSAFAIFSLGQQHEANKEKSYFQEKERQRVLAQERLAARRNKKNPVVEADSSKLEQQLADEIKTASENKATESVQDSVLSSTDSYHGSERELLLQLLQSFEESKKKKSIKKMSQEDLKRELTKLQGEHKKWLSQSQHTVVKKKGHCKPAEVAKRRAQQFKLLTKVMSYKLEVEERHLKAVKPNLDPANVREDLSVSLLSDLQQKHTEDMKAIHNLIREKDDDFVTKFKDLQETARLEGWFNNLTSVLFSVHENDLDIAEKKLDTEFEKEKQELLEKVQGDESADVETLLKNLESKFANKKKEVMSNLAREKQLIQDQLKENEDTSTFELKKIAENQTLVNTVTADTNKSISLLQERLAARRQARRKTVENERGDESGSSIKDPLAGNLFQREKSLVNFEVSEDEKRMTTQRLINQQMNLHTRLKQDQDRQEQLIQQRLQARKGKRQHEVSELLDLGERQKTILVKSKQDELERQKSLLLKRVARVKHERSITSRGSSAHSDSISGLTEDEEHTKNEKIDESAQQ